MLIHPGSQVVAATLCLGLAARPMVPRPQLGVGLGAASRCRKSVFIILISHPLVREAGAWSLLGQVGEWLTGYGHLLRRSGWLFRLGAALRLRGARGWEDPYSDSSWQKRGWPAAQSRTRSGHIYRRGARQTVGRSTVRQAVEKNVYDFVSVAWRAMDADML
ncbi:hypothetical protein NDU88_008533 [Pleurodeles waltl]|uniref:Secreted protein n=1 Tax=Pleurodeles waltl TaxID=8319 RepID=A0AAV7PSB7_PLEWA|nr:hypothetical protein NDU88_008533 [Pleurodeles waltl]